MTTSLLAPAQWAQTEFALAELGDRRRTRRLVQMASCLARSPTGRLPEAFPAWKELKAAYRFLDHLEFGPREIQQAQQTLEACRQPGEYLLIEDTTELDYSSHRRTEQLGFIGDGRGRGLLLQSLPKNFLAASNSLFTDVLMDSVIALATVVTKVASLSVGHKST